MREICLVALLILGFNGISYAKDMGFRYRGGKCVNERGEEGLNTSYLGQCSDLRNVMFARVHLDDIDFSGSQFTNSDLQQSTFDRSILDGTNFDSTNLAGASFNESKIRGASFKSVQIKNIKIAEADIRGVDFKGVDFSGVVLSFAKFQECDFSGTKFNGAILDGAEFVGSQLKSVNFSGANFHGAKLDSAVLDGADFSGADLSDATLRGTSGRSVNFRGANFQRASLERALLPQANLRDSKLSAANLEGANIEASDIRSADLSGARVNGAILKDVVYGTRTILPFSEDVAKSRGMKIKSAARLLIIWDEKSTYLASLTSALQAEEAEVILSSTVESSFSDAEVLKSVDAVLHLNTQTYNADMPLIGQKALVEFVKNGGIFLHMEWNSYELTNGRMIAMRDLTLFDYIKGTPTRDFALVPVPEQMKHPVLRGITENIVITDASVTGTAHVFAEQPSVVLMRGSKGGNVVVAREWGAGKVIGFGFTAEATLANPGLHKLILNAINWE